MNCLRLRNCFRLQAFLEGFYDIIPKRLISIFNEQELELLISGLPTIDIDDLKANTEYHKYQPNSLQVTIIQHSIGHHFPDIPVKSGKIRKIMKKIIILRFENMIYVNLKSRRMLKFCPSCNILGLK